MPAGRLNLTIEQGASFSRTVTVLQADGTTAIDLSTATVASQIRKSADSTAVAGSVTCTVTDGTAGKFSMTMSAAQTAAMGAGTYVYDVEIDYGPSVERLLEGQVYVSPEVTRG